MGRTSRRRSVAAAVGAGALLWALLIADASRLAVSGELSMALTGVVSSGEEGPMEGVLVSAKRTGSTITVTVVTDREGRYGFPRTRIEPGEYTLKVKAIGYDLESPVSVDVRAGQTTTQDLRLRKVTRQELALQLSNAEWLESIPGTPEQKASVVNCGHCHLLQLVVRSRHDADGWLPVLKRMAEYPPLAFPLMPQRRPAPRVGEGPVDEAARQERDRRLAEYLSTINLSQGTDWSYPFKTFPRPSGRATRVIYTTYDLPRRTRQPHDVIVVNGVVWYASFGEQILGKLDPATGKITEYEVPVLKPGAPTGILALKSDREGRLWLAMQFQAGVARFDPRTERFETWKLPPELDGDHVQLTQMSPDFSHVDGKVWIVDAGTYTVLRLDIAAGKFERFEPFKIPRPNVYDVIADQQNNAYFLVMGREHVGRIDAKTGQITLYQTPTLRSGPRRGSIDGAGRIWFGENRANKIGMFDPRTQTFREWEAPTPWSLPYDVVVDREGFAWTGGEYTDRVLRLDPKLGTWIEYLLPQFTNIRRVFLDNTVTPVTFWVGSNHGASIIKLEPLDAAAATSSAAVGR